MGKLDKALEKANIQKIGTVSDLLSQDNKQEGGAVENRRNKLHNNKQDSSKHNICEYGHVDFRVVVYHKPESLAAEHFKVLRGALMQPQNGRVIKSVLVTSALEQEGKTMVSCNLAVSIAQSIDPYVLLIDADVRRPSVHSMLGLRKSSGLTDYLQTGKPLSNFLMKGILEKMTVLQAGSTVRNPAELMTSGKMQGLLDEVRNRYADRFIIIDSPPVNLTAETLTLARYVDAVVLVVRYGVSDKNAVQEAVEKLGKDSVFGIVFNGFEITPRKYTYYKKRYYSTAY